MESRHPYVQKSTLLTAERTPGRSKVYVLHKLGSKGTQAPPTTQSRGGDLADRTRRWRNNLRRPRRDPVRVSANHPPETLRLVVGNDRDGGISGRIHQAARATAQGRTSLHRFSAGSFFGGFRTPALLPGVPLAPGRHPKPFPKADINLSG